MSPIKPRKELKYYDSILYWLSDNGYYIGEYVERNKRKSSFYKNLGQKIRADCAGIKNIGNRYVDEVEIAVVEVKDRKITLRHIEQAYGYSIYAHKCYLATTQEIDEKSLSLAHRFGVGLLKIDPDTNKRKKLHDETIEYYGVEEILSPQIMNPNKTEMLAFLSKLGVRECTLCHNYVLDLKESDEHPRTVKRLRRQRQFAIMTETDEWPTKRVSGYGLIRFLCLECQSLLDLI